jgi:hypothetical protein
MLDFDALVLAPCMDAFAIDILVAPLISRPGAPVYPARGIYNQRSIDVPTEDGSILNSHTVELGIRLSEYPIPVKQGDRITIVTPPPGANGMAGRVFTIEDLNEDGQGGSGLVLKILTAPDSARARAASATGTSGVSGVARASAQARGSIAGQSTVSGRRA